MSSCLGNGADGASELYGRAGRRETMGSKDKVRRIKIGEPIYASEPAPTKGKPIIPIEDD